MEPDGSSPSDVCCILCERSEESKVTGALSSKDGVSAHQNCLIYASGIYSKLSPTFDDLFGFEVDDVKKEYRRGKKLTCNYCKKKGATAGCEVKSCPRSYHYPCAREARAKPVKNSAQGSYMLYCKYHAYPKRPAGQPCASTERNGAANHGETSSGSESALSTGSRSKKRRVQYVISSDSESDVENNTPPQNNVPPQNNTPSLDNGPPEQDQNSKSISGDKRTTGEPAPSTSEGVNVHFRNQGVPPCQGGDGDETDIELSAESPSLLPSEHRYENVPMTVIIDSGPSIESENSYCCPTSPGPAAAGGDPPPSLAAAGDMVTPNSTSTLPAPLVPRRLPFDCPPPGGAGVADPSGSPGRSADHPLDSRGPPPPAEPMEGARERDSTAARFWWRCSELGCTEVIFGELTEQLIGLAERVQTRQATQQDYNIALRMLDASGKLPDIFRRQEEDLEEQIQELQKKRQVLRDARGLLDTHHRS
ncbi:uncharacterized protein phf11 isoform X2 [Brachyhypopomus gauderio]|uniref:uncharacterized protein phf11 isoform X2 n=1 Tax=Brachyhypopomus gauderio TaxID=698409 RepID=UPI004041C663